MKHRFALDFHHAFLPAAHAVLHGTTPYSAIGSHALADGTAFLYPPLAAYLFIPFTVLPTRRRRDPRRPARGRHRARDPAGARHPRLALLRVSLCIWWPDDHRHPDGERHAAAGAGARTRLALSGQAVVVALLSGFMIALKLFFWPLLVWLVATRRYRTAALTAVASLAFVFLPWAGIGFAGLRRLRPCCSSSSRTGRVRDSYSLAALSTTPSRAGRPRPAVETASAPPSSLVVLVRAPRPRPRRVRARDPRDARASRRCWRSTTSPCCSWWSRLIARRFGAAWLAPLFIWGASQANNGRA